MTRAILLDIEGTTTSIDFVARTLFPYSLRELGAYISAALVNRNHLIDAVKAEYDRDTNYPSELDTIKPDSVADYLRYLTDRDRKSTALKEIQGEIWSAGYRSGELLSHVFEDVPAAFARWNQEGRTVAIYSSGSVLAQQLLFRHTTFGDLTKYIDRYFDTHIGPKTASESYTAIARELAAQPAEITFVSDSPTELSAARRAGLDVVLSVRPANASSRAANSYPVITSFEYL